MNVFKRFITNVLANSQWIPIQIRTRLYNWMGIKTNRSEIRPGCFFNSEYVNIGENSFINFYSQFHSGYDEDGLITLGSRCYIGMNVVLCAISHEVGSHIQRAGNNIYRPIIIGEGTWIGANSIILPGVEIGEGCIIAAGSVVTKNCEANCLYAGNPAKKIKILDGSSHIRHV